MKTVKEAAKRGNIVRLQMVRESSLLYSQWRIRMVSVGSLDSSIAHPGETFKTAIRGIRFSTTSSGNITCLPLHEK